MAFSATNLDATTTGNGNAYLSGSGTTTIDATGLNAGTGTIELDNGTFAESAANGINTAATLNVVSPATLDLAGFNQEVAAVTGSGTVTDSGAAANFTVNNANSDTFVGSLSGANLGFVKSGTGTLILPNAENPGGGTTIDSGTLQVDGSIGSAHWPAVH